MKVRGRSCVVPKPTYEGRPAMRPSKSVRYLSITLAIVLLAAIAAGCAKSATTTSEPGAGVVGGFSPAAPTGGSDTARSSEQLAPAPPVVTGQAGDVSATTPESDRMIIRSSTLRLEVKSTSKAVETIRTLIADNKGIITDLQVAT